MGKSTAKSTRGRANTPRPQEKVEHQTQQGRLEHARALRHIDAAYGLARTFVRCLAVVGSIGFVYLIVRTIAGTQTEFSATVRAALDLSADRWIAYAVAVTATGGYYYQRQLRVRTIKGTAAYTKALEQRIDPKRSTSGLSLTGRPRKEDLDAP